MLQNIFEILACVSMIALLHTYFIYPFIAWSIGGAKEKHPSTDEFGISVLVPAFNEANVIEEKIKNFKEIDYDGSKIELLINDDGSDDGTREIIERYISSNIRLLDLQPRAGKATGLNRMVKEAKFPFLLLCDANVMFRADALKKLARHMSKEEIGAVTGRVSLIGSHQDFEQGESLYYSIERRIQEAESRIGSVMGVDGGMYLLRKELFEELPADTLLDDFAISINVIRKGFRIVYDGSAQAVECGTSCSAQEFSRRVRMMAGVVQLFRRGILPRVSQPIIWIQFVSHKLLRWLTPFLIGLLFVSSAGSASSNEVAGLTLVTMLTGVIIFGLSASLPRLRRSRLGSIIFYFGMSQIAILFGTYKGLRNQQKVLWSKDNRSSVANA